MNSKMEIQKALEKELNERVHLEGDTIVILAEETIEGNDYFIFFYNSKNFIETANYSFYLAGNAPIIVNKLNGEKYITGTVDITEYYIDLYKKGLLKRW